MSMMGTVPSISQQPIIIFHDAWSPLVAVTWSERTDELHGDKPADDAAAAPVKFINDV